VIQRLVADEVGHALPVPRQRLRVQTRDELLEPMDREHGLVGSSGRVEEDPLLDRPRVLAEVLLGVAQPDVEVHASFSR
jgi:hypothetical protein